MSIPANEIVTINPGVLGSGGNPLSLNGVLLTTSLNLPTGGALPFGSAASVGAYFGLTSDEYFAAQKYFLGFDNSTIKPAVLWLAPYVDAARAAFLRSGNLASLTLAQVQALSGTLTLVIDGFTETSDAMTLSSVTSFSDAADQIAAAFKGDHVPVVVWDAELKRFVLSSNTTGATSTMGFATAGTIANALKLTSATGAVLSQGADVDTVDSAMTTLTLSTQNWASFTTIWEPLDADKLLFADWTNAQNQRYLYVAWDTNEAGTVGPNADCFGFTVKDLAYDGVVVVYNTLDLAMFLMGTTASIDFSRLNGRITYKFRAQSGFVPTVTDPTVGANLTQNGYNFYGDWANSTNTWKFLGEGQIAGKWLWIDCYVNQIYLNSQFQTALMSLLTVEKSIPYNQPGRDKIRAAMQDPINSGLNFGSVRTGIALSESQKAQLNQAAGRDVATTIEQQGYYLQILDPGAQVRGNRGTPVINFWYTDGGAVHKINVASIDVI